MNQSNLLTNIALYNDLSTAFNGFVKAKLVALSSKFKSKSIIKTGRSEAEVGGVTDPVAVSNESAIATMVITHASTPEASQQMKGKMKLIMQEDENEEAYEDFTSIKPSILLTGEGASRLMINKSSDINPSSRMTLAH
ncbi:hypothetical protein E3N88_23669 [Mikania micrantha]|uniref:Uncharacterized protein n=1 Tax=Mikania micrantha TaxID=192012 RepID=A0A5N6NGK6_9ASTR|nr:hypothetical protein E3N88_23669 [Mikania micrantha]